MPKKIGRPMTPNEVAEQTEFPGAFLCYPKQLANIVFALFNNGNVYPALLVKRIGWTVHKVVNENGRPIYVNVSDAGKAQADALQRLLSVPSAGS